MKKIMNSIFVHFKYSLMPGRHTYFFIFHGKRKSNGHTQPSNSI